MKSAHRQHHHFISESQHALSEINHWQIRAIQEGLIAAERGELDDFNKTKEYWVKRLEDTNNKAGSN